MEYLGLIIVFGALMLLLLSGVHIAFAMIIVGVVLLFLEKGTGLLDMVSWSAWAVTNSFVLTAIPLFFLMGEFIMRGGMASELYNGITSWIYWFPGKCLQSNIATCSMFAAISGSSVATAATFARIAIPPQKQLRYSEQHIYGSIAAGGTLGILIPPSVDFIVYGAFTEQSIPKLFAAGVIPGLILSSLFMVTILIMAVINPQIAPPVPAKDYTWKVRLLSLRAILPLATLAMVVLGGIYTGLFTPTEAASVGAFGALLLVVSFGRSSVRLLWDSIVSAARVTAWLTFLLVGASILSFGLGQSGIARQSINALCALNLSPITFISVLMVIYIILGCMVEGLALMLLTISMVFPIVVSMGLDPIWFGVMMIVMCECALITPPVGLNLFVISGVANAPLSAVIKGAIPFVTCVVILMVILVAFPNLALIIPSLM